MRGHRTYLDTPHIVTTPAYAPPLPRWHRNWLNAASGMRAGTATTEGRGAKPASPTAASGDAQ